MQRSQLIDVESLTAKLGAPGWQILDCRFELGKPDAGRVAFLQGHIPGAAYVHLDDDLAAPVTSSTGRHPLPDPDWMAKRFAAMGISNETEVVVYDGGNGAIAARAWWLLRWLGHDQVRLLDGGYSAWLERGRESASGESIAGRGIFRPSPRMERLISTEELLSYGDGLGAANLLDARDGARFRGEVEPIDPVAGHIPGARSLPLTESIAADGRWKQTAALQAVWECALGTDREVEWAVMCGSGVTACHLALSGIQAGYREPRVYVGSWSEWIRDRTRSVATGSG